MREFNDPAYPSQDDFGTAFGMTIRQRAALMAAAGIASNPGCAPTRQEHFDNIAADALRIADAVLRLERETRGA